MRDKEIRNDLKIYDEAMLDIDSEKWKEAMKSKIDSMHSNQVWTLVDPSEGIVPIGWISKRKIGSDGKVETYKARLIVKGYSQHESVDYQKIFLSMVILKSIQSLLAVAVYHEYKIW